MSRIPTASAYAPKNTFRMYRSPILGSDLSMYMDRYVLQTPWFTLRGHRICRPDAAEDLHDHPWGFLSFLWRPYVERVPTLSRREIEERKARIGRPLSALLTFWNWLRPATCLTTPPTLVEADTPGVLVDIVHPRFSLVFHFAEDRHRIVELPDGPAWTFVISGPYQKKWGFHTKNGWVPWDEHESFNPPQTPQTEPS